MRIIQKKKTCRICSKEVYIYAKHCCKKCYLKHVKPPKPLKKTKVKKISETGKARNLAYKKAREEYLLTHDHCEVAAEGCLYPYPVTNPKEALTIHHRRGRIGPLLTDQDYFLACCIHCHRALEDAPEWAYQNGWSLPRID